MKKDVMISIQGLYHTDGDEDSVELITKGQYAKRNGYYFIRYQETEATGFTGCTTTLKVEGSDRVTISRTGDQISCLTIEKNRRNQCHYNTPLGSFLLGVYGDSIESTLNDEGGDLQFKYSLDVNATNTSVNNVTVTVKECKKS